MKNKLTEQELEYLIPSETVREYCKQENTEFTDWQLACLAIQSNMPPTELFHFLQNIAEDTTNQELQNQIELYLTITTELYHSIKDNPDRNCIYILNVACDDEWTDRPDGYYFDYEKAYQEGLSEGEKFKITKYVVKDSDEEKENTEVSEMIYKADGAEKMFYSGRGMDKYYERYYFKKSFTDGFYDVPNPFERGDIIKVMGSEPLYGIVDTTKEEWIKTLNRKNNPKFADIIDYSDVVLRVVLLEDDGEFSHAHINPVDLEIYKIDEEIPYNDIPAMDQLLMAASRLYKGTGCLDELYYFAFMYRTEK